MKTLRFLGLHHINRRGLYLTLRFSIYKDSVFEATSVFEAATKKNDCVPKQKPKALFHLLCFFSLIDYTPPTSHSEKSSFWSPSMICISFINNNVIISQVIGVFDHWIISCLLPEGGFPPLNNWYIILDEHMERSGTTNQSKIQC